MKTLNNDILTTTGRLLGKMGPVTRLIDGISERFLPKTTARASGSETVCYTYCGAYCDHGQYQAEYQVTAASPYDCSIGNYISTDYLGCSC